MIDLPSSRLSFEGDGPVPEGQGWGWGERPTFLGNPFLIDDTGIRFKEGEEGSPAAYSPQAPLPEMGGKFSEWWVRRARSIMIVAGVDVGSLTAEAVVMKDGEILGYEIINVRPTPIQSSMDVMLKTLIKCGLRLEDLNYCVSTGYGRDEIPFSKKSISEISCHGKGAHWCNPAIRGIIDIGGQDCKAIMVGEEGDLVDFAMNDKCAAGTGRFLEIIAKALGADITELGAMSFDSKTPLKISNRCSVFAEYETIFLLAEGKQAVDIGAGVNEAMAERAFSLAGRIKLNGNIGGGLTVTGGVAKNVGVTKNLAHLFQTEIADLSWDPQIMGALGAALFAQRNYEKESR